MALRTGDGVSLEVYPGPRMAAEDEDGGGRVVGVAGTYLPRHPQRRRDEETKKQSGWRRDGLYVY